MKLSTREASEKGLTSKLFLLWGKKGKEGRTDYLADIEHPRGGTVIMEVYLIKKETRNGFTLAEISNEERKKLICKYEKGTGNGFGQASYTEMRESYQP